MSEEKRPLPFGSTPGIEIHDGCFDLEVTPDPLLAEIAAAADAIVSEQDPDTRGDWVEVLSNCWDEQSETAGDSPEERAALVRLAGACLAAIRWGDAEQAAKAQEGGAE